MTGDRPHLPSPSSIRGTPAESLGVVGLGPSPLLHRSLGRWECMCPMALGRGASLIQLS